MKKLNLLFGILVGLTILSCSSNDDDNSQLAITELLIQNSPWTFSHYEMIDIINSGNSNFTQTEIENDINSRENEIILMFNQDGTGSKSKPNEYTNNWNWEVVNGNQLKVYHVTLLITTEEIISVSANQLVTEHETGSYDESVQNHVIHNGKYYYE